MGISNLHSFLKLFRIRFLLLMLLGSTLMYYTASGNDNYPRPHTDTYADYYVSWDHGDNANPGTLDLPFKTPDMAVSTLKSLPDPSGKIVLIREGTYRLVDDAGNRLYLTNLHGKPEAPIQIRGYPGETVLLDSFLEPFDPLAYPVEMKCGWGGISFNKSSHIIVENFKVTGRCVSNVELLDSNYITIRFIDAYRSNQHGLFTGGSFHNLLVEACRFSENIYGDSASHGVYVSGGSWDPSLPPVRGVTLRYVESYFNGRHGIQVNGRAEDITVEHCNLHHNILGGLSLIGTRNVRVSHNLIYKNNKQGIILFTYFDTAYWDPEDPESVQHWLDTHWTIKNVLIENNTIFMDDGPWYDDPWINYDPTWHAAIILVDTTELLAPFSNITIQNNILYNHSKMMINFKNPEHFEGTRGYANLMLSEGYPETIACNGPVTIEDLEAYYPDAWSGNLWGEDPDFYRLLPTELIDCTHQQVDFSDPAYATFEDSFLLNEDSPAWTLRAGAFLVPFPLAWTDIDTGSYQKIPPHYGKYIARFIFSPQVKPEIKLWFLNNFNPYLHCLKVRYSQDKNERICFKNPVQQCIAFALMNRQDMPVNVETRLFSEEMNMSYPKAFGITFNSSYQLGFLPDLNIVDNAIQCTLDERSLAIFIVEYEEAP